MKLVLVALVTALLAAGTTQAVNRLVTSKDIRNGTIRSVDLHASVRAQLARKAIQVEHQESLPDMFPRTVLASCPPGTVLTGGGYSVGGHVDESQPDTTTHAWAVTAERDYGATSGFVRVYAVCLS